MSRLAAPTGDDVEIPERPHLSDKKRLEIYLAANGRCENPSCNVKVGKGEYEIDHTEQRWLRGDDGRENLRVLCIPCHKLKSAKDAKVRKKVRGMSKLSLSEPRTKSPAWRGSRPFAPPRRVPAGRKT